MPLSGDCMTSENTVAASSRRLVASSCARSVVATHAAATIAAIINLMLHLPFIPILSPRRPALSDHSGTDQDHFMWTTQKSWGTTCCELTFKFIDGTVATAVVNFKYDSDTSASVPTPATAAWCSIAPHVEGHMGKDRGAVVELHYRPQQPSVRSAVFNTKPRSHGDARREPAGFMRLLPAGGRAARGRREPKRQTQVALRERRLVSAVSVPTAAALRASPPARRCS